MEEGWKAIRKRKKGNKERGDERKKRMKKERNLTHLKATLYGQETESGNNIDTSS